MPGLKLWGEHQISKMKRDMDRRFEALCADFGLPPARPFGDAGLDLSETGNEVVIRISAPGLNPEDLGISVTHRRVAITCNRVFQTEQGVRAESFHKEIYLPCPVTADDVSASYTQGVIEIRIPKRVALRCGLPQSLR